MNRFTWITKDLIRIVNREGIEKLVSLKENSEEIEYNVIPLFDNKEVKKNHFYKNRSALGVKEVLERLKRKYQHYKSAYYLEHKTEPFSLY